MSPRALLSAWLQRLPAFLTDWRGMLIVQALFVFIAMSPELVGGRLFVDSDSQSLNYPFQLFLFTLQGLRDGSFLWNPWNFHGFPSFLGEASSTMPLAHVIALMLPPLAAYHWTLFADMTLGSFFFALLLRRFGVSALGAWVGGTAYTTMMWWNMRWASSTVLPCVIPLVLWYIWDSREHPWRALGLGTLLQIYIWSSMHWIHLPLMWTLGLVFSVGIIWMGWHESRRIRLVPFIIFCATVAISGLIMLPKILPALMYADLSFRSNGVDWSIASTGGFTPFTVLRFFFPFISFPLITDAGRAFVFVGTFAIVFALIAISARRTKTVYYLLAAYVFFFLLGIERSPLLHLLLSVPPFSYVRSEGPWITVANVALAALAAIGYDAVIGDLVDVARRRAARWLGWISGIILAGSLAAMLLLTIFRPRILAWMFHLFDTRFYHQTSGLSLEHYHATLAGYIDQTVLNVNPLYPQTGFALLALAAVAFLMSDNIWKRMGELRGPIVASAAVLTTLPLVFLQMQPLTIAGSEFPFQTQTSAYLKEHGGESFSVFPNFAKFLILDQMQPTLAEGVRFQAEMLLPNRNLWYGVSSIDYFDNFMSSRMGTLLGFAGSEQIQGNTWLARQPLTPEKKVATMLARKDILDLLNTRTILSVWPLQNPSLTLAKTVSLPRNIPLYIYDNIAARPFAYFADGAVIIRPDEQTALQTLLQNKWPGTKSLIECDRDCNNTQPTGNGTVTVTTERPTLIGVMTSADSPQWLIVSVNNLPGWRVRIDGKETRPVMANATFFGIRVPAGRHDVTMAFTYRSLLQDSVMWLQAKIEAKFHRT